MATVVVGVTNTETAGRAAIAAADLARELGATLHLVSATRQKGMTTVGTSAERFVFGNIDLAQQHIATLRVQLGSGVEMTSAVVSGSPAKVLCGEAKRIGADIIVVGSARTKGVGRVLGSVASDVIKQAPCDVYVAQTDDEV